MVPESAEAEPLRLLAATVSAAQARRLLEPPGRVLRPLWWIYSRGYQLRTMERVYVPYWVCAFRLVVQRGLQEKTVPVTHVLVNALTGECGQLPDPLQFHQGARDQVDSPLLPYTVPAERALASASRAQGWNLVMLGTRRKWRSIQVEPLETFLAYVPFWVGYFTSNTGQIRVKAVHGMAGVVEKQMTVIAILRGLQRLETTPE